MSQPHDQTTAGEERRKPPALLSFFARHANAHNLLMAIMIMTGGFFLRQLNTQFFPTIDVPAITVVVLWPGASAEDVEANIIEALEPGMRSIAGLDKLSSTAQEGSALILLEFDIGTDMQRGLSDVESAVSDITTLPKDSEPPEVSRVLFYENIMSLALSGPFSEQAIKTYAMKIRNDLLRLGIDRVTFRGARDDEIWVEVSKENLRRFNLTLDTISRRIRDSSEDLPSGTLSGLAEQQIRSIGLEDGPNAISRLEVRSMQSGEKLLLRDIAVVRETFDDNAPTGIIDGQPAIRINILRSATADILEVSDIADAYLKRIRPSLPKSLKIEKFDVQSDRVRQRIAVLVKNGAGGLFLVLIVLFLFLNSRVAFWVAVGIPTAMIASFTFMYLAGQSINMISLFALIMMLGIVVDDAIVVGEHTAAMREKGLSPIDAVEQGTAHMAAPVFASSLTTIAAFMPMFLISDIIGEIMKPMALAVIIIIFMSLAEAFFVLPGHMRRALAHTKPKKENIISKIQIGFNKKFEAFREGPFHRFMERTYKDRYIAAASVFGAMIISIGLMTGGHVVFQFFPAPEAETIYGRAVFLPGTPKEQVVKALKEMEAAVIRAEIEITGKKGTIVKTYFSEAGSIVGGGGDTGTAGDHLGQVTVELLPSEVRTVRTVDFLPVWRSQIPKFYGLDQLVVVTQKIGPPGRDVDIRLEDAPIKTLKEAARQLKKELSAFSGISDVEDDLPWGKREVLLEVTPRGYALGFTTQEVGKQMRNAFEGSIARRFPRREEEITVRVRLPENDSGVKTFSDIYLRAPNGQEVPLTDIVSISKKVGFARIKRLDGLRTVSVTAELNQDILPLVRLQQELEAKVMPKIAKDFDISYSFGGRTEEQTQAFDDLGYGLLLALAMIYFILAGVLGNYGQPIVIMAIIPFGFIGAVLGHFVMGYDITILALIALLGLAGILINDSIVLVVQIQEYTRKGMDMRDAVVNGTKDRLRAVILTSATTVFGLLPLLFERSLQAAFLKPMAISISWGVTVGTVLILFIVPSFLGILNDIKGVIQRRKQAAPAA